jgi:SAM-dependent methyltransferase
VPAEARFSADWLELREGVDHGSRAESLVEPLLDKWRRRRWSRILDLGGGTGSNLRYLAPRLPGEQHWTVVDHDGALLARVDSPEGGGRVERVEGDLAREGLARVASSHLVTASALLDLVSEGWLRRLAEGCRESGAGVLLALTYDGTVGWAPGSVARFEAPGRTELPEPLDARVLDAVNRHQERDKGLGPALGPRAVEAAEALFREVGYVVRVAPSPWILGPEEIEVVQHLVEGWVHAAGEEEPELAPGLVDWGRQRVDGVARGGRWLVVGHRDLLALPRR